MLVESVFELTIVNWMILVVGIRGFKWKLTC